MNLEWPSAPIRLRGAIRLPMMDHMEEFEALLAELAASGQSDDWAIQAQTIVQSIYDGSVIANNSLIDSQNALSEKDAVIAELTARISQLESENFNRALNEGSDDDDDNDDDDEDRSVNSIDDLFE